MTTSPSTPPTKFLSDAEVSRSSLRLAFAVGLMLLALVLVSGATVRGPGAGGPGAGLATVDSPPTGTWTAWANGDDILELAAEDGVVWAGTRAGGLVRWDTAAGTYVQFLRPQHPLAGNTVFDVYVDPTGYKWLATDGGLNVFNDNGTAARDDDQWYSVTRASSGGGLPSDRVTAIAPDAADPDVLWIGTAQYWDAASREYAGGGLVKLDTHGTPDPADDTWRQTYTLEGTMRTVGGDNVLGLASDNIAAVLSVAGDRVWIGTRRQVFVNSSGTVQEMFGGLSRLDHNGTDTPSDDDWRTWNTETGTSQDFPDVVTRLEEDAAGNVWAATAGWGVLAFPPDAVALTANHIFTDADGGANGLASDYIDAIAFSPSEGSNWAGTVWISTRSGLSDAGLGVSVLDYNDTLTDHSDDSWNALNPRSGSPITTEDGLPGDRVQAMAAGGSGATEGLMWLGIGGRNGNAYGLVAFDLASKTAQPALTTGASGLASNYVTDIAAGEPGTRWQDQVWVATGNRRRREVGAGAFLLDTRGTLDTGDDTWTRFTKESTDPGGYPWSGLGSNNVTGVDLAGDNAWFSTLTTRWELRGESYAALDGGLSVYDGAGWTNRTVASTEAASGGDHLRWDALTTVEVGCEGNVWVGLGELTKSKFGLGLDVLDPGGSPHNLNNDSWVSFEYDRIVSNVITAIAADCSRSRMLIGGEPWQSYGGGVGVYDFATESWTGSFTAEDGIESFSSSSSTGQVESVAVGGPEAGGPEAGGPGAGLVMWAGTWGTADMTAGQVALQRPYLPAVANWYDGSQWQHRVFEGDGWVAAIAADAEGFVWLGTSTGGMDNQPFPGDGLEDDAYAYRAEAGIKLTDGADWWTWTPSNSALVAPDIEAIVVAANGDVWIGTSGWGLMRFRPGAGPTPTVSATPTAAVGTNTPVVPTATGTVPSSPTLTPTATVTGSASTPTPTSTLSPTATEPGAPTSTPTRDTPTPTATVAGTVSPTPASGWQYLPLLARNLRPAGPTFACGDWCTAGSQPGLWRQTVTSDRPLDDWRAFLRVQGSEFSLEPLEETATAVVVEAPQGTFVRVEAFYQGEWWPACGSDVVCPTP